MQMRAAFLRCSEHMVRYITTQSVATTHENTASFVLRNTLVKIIGWDGVIILYRYSDSTSDDNTSSDNTSSTIHPVTLHLTTLLLDVHVRQYIYMWF